MTVMTEKSVAAAPVVEMAWAKVAQAIALNSLIRGACEGQSEDAYQACGVVDDLLREVDSMFEAISNLAGAKA